MVEGMTATEWTVLVTVQKGAEKCSGEAQDATNQLHSANNFYRNLYRRT